MLVTFRVNGLPSHAFVLILRCRNCGSAEHRHWECPEQKNVTNNVLCTKCGAAGHLASDCIQTE